MSYRNHAGLLHQGFLLLIFHQGTTIADDTNIESQIRSDVSGGPVPSACRNVHLNAVTMDIFKGIPCQW